MTVIHHLRVHRSDENLAREGQLAWRIAEVAADPVDGRARGRRHGHQPRHRQRGRRRGIPDAAPRSSRRASRRSTTPCRSAARARRCSAARSTRRYSPEWAAWANGVAVRELDYHDTFLAAEYSHPGDNIPPILAVAQHVGADGAALVRGIATGYEIQIDLVKAISLHKHKIDHVAHLGPSAAAGIGTLLGLDAETIYQAIGQALHTTTATRQSRKGEISTWKAHAPAFAGQDGGRGRRPRDARRRPRRAPIYEGEDGVIAWLLDGPDAAYEVPLPERGRGRSARILDTYTKEHSAEYQAQAWIDLARRLGTRAPGAARPGEHRVDRAAHQPPHPLRDRLGRERPAEVRPDREPRDARPLDPVHLHGRAAGRRLAPRRLLRPRARRRGPTPSRCGTRSRPSRTPEWTRRYHSNDPAEKAFGGRVEIGLADGDAHRRRDRRRRRAPARRPAVRARGLRRASSACWPSGVLEAAEIERFLELAAAAARADARRGRRG